MFALRRLLVIAAVIALAAADCRSEQPTVQQILALEGAALWEAADDLEKENLSSADLIKIVRRLVVDPNKSRADSLDKFALSNCFQAACNKANAAELQELIEIYVSFDHESFEKQFDFPHLAARWIREQLKTTDCGREKDLVTNKTPITVPAELEGSAPELAEAWKAYRALVHPVEQTIYSDSSRNSTISFQANQRAFFKLLDDVLLKRGEGLAERLVKFDWSGSSGTGSELVSEPQSIAIFMALLSERRIPEALGAALYVRDRPLVTADTNVRVEFLRACGVDWEKIFAGAQIESDRRGLFAGYDNSILKELAGFGADRAARLVATMARQAKPGSREAYAHAISAFLTGESTKHLRFSNGAYDRISKRSISNPVKLELVRVLQDFAQPGVSADLAQAVLDGFARAQIPETKSTLYVLAKHPSALVAEQAADVLRMMGEKIAPPITAPPVRFRIIVNGEPMAAHSDIWWEVGGTSSSYQIGKNGTLTIDRRVFLEADPKPTNVVLSSRGWKTPEGPIFKIEAPLPADFDAVAEVNVKVFSFPLTIHAPIKRPDSRDLKASVEIKQRPPGTLKDSNELQDRFAYALRQNFDVVCGQSVTLSVQDGDYDVVVTATGSSRLVKQITVPSEAPILEIHLTAGSDLRYELIRPDGEKRAPLELLKEGQRMSEHYYDREKRTFCWLPPGSYVLHIPSSKDLASDDGDFMGYGPADIPWSGRDIPFTITPDSPPVIDLGKIILERAADLRQP